MGEFFQWIGTLEPPVAWGMFALLALLMAAFPFAGIWLKALKIKFSNRQPKIHDFSWRIIPEVKVGETGGKRYYVTNSESPVIYEGMVVQICWHVTGAYRIDVHPLGKNLKGNSAHVVISKGCNRYKLTAHTWEGKLTRELDLSNLAVRNLHTFNLSREDHFGQPHSVLDTVPLASTRYGGTRFSRMGVPMLKSLLLKRLFSRLPRKYASNRKLLFETALPQERNGVRKFIESQTLVKTYRFKPGAYNDALNQTRNNHQNNMQ